MHDKLAQTATSIETGMASIQALGGTHVVPKAPPKGGGRGGGNRGGGKSGGGGKGGGGGGKGGRGGKDDGVVGIE